MGLVQWKGYLQKLSIYFFLIEDFVVIVTCTFRIADATTPEDRMQAVVKWYLTSIHVGRNGSVAKKPYNPIIGETFHCNWRIPRDSIHGEVSVLVRKKLIETIQQNSLF